MRWKNIMKALRIKLTQSMASYTREETVNNRMTYPLPQYSTIIGALHSACGYNSYHEMNISVQGKYSSMQKETYTNHALLDNLHDDRGNLIWLVNSNGLNTGYIRVAEALKGIGNSFKDNITIKIYDNEKLEEYVSLCKKRKELDQYKNEVIKVRESEVKDLVNKLNKTLKDLDSKSDEAKAIKENIKSEKEKLNILKDEFKLRENIEYESLIKHFRTLTKGPQTQEVLYDIELVIHVSAENEVLNDIVNNINNFVCLGRSEDFIELQEIKEVELIKEVNSEYSLKEGYAIYANLERLDSEDVYDFKVRGNDKAEGTVYYVSKDYKIEEDTKKRIFNKIPCLYTSCIFIDENSELGNGVYIDIDKTGEAYIVDLN